MLEAQYRLIGLKLALQPQRHSARLSCYQMSASPLTTSTITSADTVTSDPRAGPLP